MRSTRLDGLVVLLVEDEPIIALDVTQTLVEAGAAVIGPAHTVAAALDLIERHDFDVAVLDFRLETQTATVIAERLMRERRPFLFHTSSIEASDAHPGVVRVNKPTRPEQLVAAVAAVAGRP